MKKIFLTHVLLLLNLMLFANAVSLESAQKTAVIYFRYFVSDKTDYSISDVYVQQEDGLTTFYIFNFTSGGFIIVSADDAALPFWVIPKAEHTMKITFLFR